MADDPNASPSSGRNLSAPSAPVVIRQNRHRRLVLGHLNTGDPCSRAATTSESGRSPEVFRIWYEDLHWDDTWRASIHERIIVSREDLIELGFMALSALSAPSAVVEEEEETPAIEEAGWLLERADRLRVLAAEATKRAIRIVEKTAREAGGRTSARKKLERDILGRVYWIASNVEEKKRVLALAISEESTMRAVRRWRSSPPDGWVVERVEIEDQVLGRFDQVLLENGSFVSLEAVLGVRALP